MLIRCRFGIALDMHLPATSLLPPATIGVSCDQAQRAMLQGTTVKPNRNQEMKWLAAAIALLCVSSAALAHDIYSTLRDRDGHLCCGGQDCKPVEAVGLPDGSSRFILWQPAFDPDHRLFQPLCWLGAGDHSAGLERSI
jgi:hypothetical protein